MIARECAQCGKEFLALPREVMRGRGKYCGRLCRNIANRKPRGRRNCAQCGQEFILPCQNEVRKGKGQFCSPKCYNKNRDKPLEKRFWSSVEKSSECWWWVGSKSCGYGTIKVQKVNNKAHRVSWEIHHGPIPEGMHVLHKCDNPACVNPEHLWLGTHADNMHDREKKGRGAHGSHSTKAKLTEEDILKIREIYASGARRSEIAMQFGVVHSTITAIVHRKAWKHVT